MCQLYITTVMAGDGISSSGKGCYAFSRSCRRPTDFGSLSDPGLQPSSFRISETQMTFLEAILMKLTRETPIGGTCQLGDASITVRCSADQWEWEYKGVTFWDLGDLAETIIQDCTAFPTKLPYRSRMARTVRDALTEETSPREFFLESPERPWGQAL
jgi:hypothetical protein